MWTCCGKTQRFSAGDVVLINPQQVHTGNQTEDFHDVIAERYERKSTIVTSNLDVPEWTDAFPNRILGEATIDRLRHGAYTVVLEGKSYRSPRSVSNLPGNKDKKKTKNSTLKGGEKS